MILKRLGVVLALCCLPALGIAQAKKPSTKGKMGHTMGKMMGKGHSAKSHSMHGKSKGHSMPMRDKKTGRFVSSKGKSHMTHGKMKGQKMGGKKGGHKMPPRDPKTGRFMKAGGKKKGGH